MREKDDPDRVGYTVWGPFAEDTDYVDPSTKPFMFNFRVADLQAYSSSYVKRAFKSMTRSRSTSSGSLDG